MVGKHEYKVTLEVMEENLEGNCSVSPRDASDSNYHDLVGSFDAWAGTVAQWRHLQLSLWSESTWRPERV
jgi:hypothetical protein